MYLSTSVLKYLATLPLTRSDMDHTVLPANNTISAFTLQSQSITALRPVLTAPTHEG